MNPEPILPAPRKCKGYFAVPAQKHVKPILPPVCPPTIDKHDAKSIMRLSIRWVWFPAAPGSGGLDGHVDAVRHQERLLAPASQPESSSRTGPRSALPDPSVLRPTRSGSGEVRNAAPGQPRTGVGYFSSRAIRLFAGDVLSGGTSFYGRRTARTAATSQRATPGIQIVRSSSATIAPNLARRTNPAGGGFAAAFTARFGALRSSTQYRTGADPRSKKSLPMQDSSLTLVRSPATLRQDYENLRCQALQANDPSLDRLFLEQQGMAAWMQFVPVPAAVFSEPGLALSPELVRVLTNLVIGSRRESEHE